MTKAQFRTLVFEIARAKQLRVDQMQDGKERIWFNETSEKFLHVDHIDSLFDVLRQPNLTKREINAEIQRVAPGRPCTHKDMRDIYEQIHQTS